MDTNQPTPTPPQPGVAYVLAQLLERLEHSQVPAPARGTIELLAREVVEALVAVRHEGAARDELVGSGRERHDEHVARPRQPVEQVIEREHRDRHLRRRRLRLRHESRSHTCRRRRMFLRSSTVCERL